MTSLGDRRFHDHNQTNGKRHVSSALQLAVQGGATSTTACVTPDPTRTLCGTAPVPRGFLPTLTYSLVAFAVPILFFYASPDFGDTSTIVTTIALSAVGGGVIIIANDCCCWYNMMLFFHLAIEARVVEKTFAFANASGTSDTDSALALAAVIVIIVHLVPFLLLDRIRMLTLLAYAGVVVNVTTVVYVLPSELLLVSASAIALLSTTMVIAGVCEIRTSMLSLLMDATTKKVCLTCDGFEL